MAEKRQISEVVSKRLIGELDRRIKTGATTTREFCKIAGMALPNLSVIRKGERYFTIDNIQAIGEKWGLDMNKIIYGRKLDQKSTALQQLKEAVERIEEEGVRVNKIVNKNDKKPAKTKK